MVSSAPCPNSLLRHTTLNRNFLNRCHPKSPRFQKSRLNQIAITSLQQSPIIPLGVDHTGNSHHLVFFVYTIKHQIIFYQNFSVIMLQWSNWLVRRSCILKRNYNCYPLHRINIAIRSWCLDHLVTQYYFLPW